MRECELWSSHECLDPPLAHRTLSEESSCPFLLAVLMANMQSAATSVCSQQLHFSQKEKVNSVRLNYQGIATWFLGLHLPLSHSKSHSGYLIRVIEADMQRGSRVSIYWSCWCRLIATATCSDIQSDAPGSTSRRNPLHFPLAHPLGPWHLYSLPVYIYLRWAPSWFPFVLHFKCLMNYI